MTRLLPGEVKHSFWEKFNRGLRGFVAYVRPQIYQADIHAETQARNTAMMIASNQEIAERRDELQKAQLQLQYVQFKEREANLAEMERLRRELQANEGRKNRQLQERLARLGRENQMDIAEFRAKIDLIIQAKNQEFQAEQAALNRRFQEIMAVVSHERQKELTEFRAKVDMAIQEKNLNFQRWSLEQQKELQLQLKTIDAELARELRAYDRETSLKVIEEKKKSDNSPIWLTAGQIINTDIDQQPLPLRVFFSPPVLPHDRIARPTEGAKGFEMADWLAEDIRQFFGNYTAQERNIDFIYGAMVSKFFHGEAATLSLFDALKTEPTLILESSVEGDYFYLRFGYWGANYGKYRYQSLVSRLSWREALNDFAKARALKWYKRKEEWKGSGKDPADFDRRYGAETVRRFMNNLEILEREHQCIEDGDDPNEIERPYSLHKQDYEELKKFIGACHCLATGLLADEYFLADVPPENRQPPLFPELLPEVLKSIPEHGTEELVDIVVSYYQNIYEYLSQSESCWIPDIALDLAKALTALPDKKWAREQVIYSIQKWLELRGLQDLRGFENLEGLLALLDSAESPLIISDAAYVGKLNQCLEGIGENQRINVADACFKRGMNCCKHEDYEAAIRDFDQTIQLNPEQADAYYNRGLAYAKLEQYQKAVNDYTQILNSDLEGFGNLQGLIEKAEKNRAVVQGVLDEINRKQKEEEDRRRKEEAERRKKEEAERRRKEEEERRKKEEAERRRKEEAERRRKEEEVREFSFETVTVDSRGKIISRKTCTARQKIIEPGRDVILEMVHIPGGTFMMGAPESEANRDSDEIQHQVTLSSFFMGKYPVTQQQWEVIMGNNPSHFKGANLPVESVSWDEAAEFCKKLSEKTGQKYRLPTEAEWEYACRAGTTTPFYFGETITPDIVNYDGNYPYGSAPKGKYRQQTTDVGSFPPNPFGLYDMHGNVWEWCQDWYGGYLTGTVTNPTGPSSGSSRVFRGGGWCSRAGYCRSAARGRYSPGYRYHLLGFRLALSQVSR